MLFRQGYTKGGWIHFAVNHEMQTMTSIEINFFKIYFFSDIFTFILFTFYQCVYKMIFLCFKLSVFLNISSWIYQTQKVYTYCEPISFSECDIWRKVIFPKVSVYLNLRGRVLFNLLYPRFFNEISYMNSTDIIITLR